MKFCLNIKVVNLGNSEDRTESGDFMWHYSLPKKK